MCVASKACNARMHSLHIFEITHLNNCIYMHTCMHININIEMYLCHLIFHHICIWVLFVFKAAESRQVPVILGYPWSNELFLKLKEIPSTFWLFLLICLFVCLLHLRLFFCQLALAWHLIFGEICIETQQLIFPGTGIGKVVGLQH